MGIEDEKTRPALRSVKRRVPVAEQPTRVVKAVKRRPVASLPTHRLIDPFRVQLLPRGELINAAGEPDNGWLVRDETEGTEVLRFVLSREGLGTTLKRALVSGARYSFDTMEGARNGGGLVLDAVIPVREGRYKRPPREGSGHLFDAAGQRDAGFVLRPGNQVICLDAASKVSFEALPGPEGVRVMARKRTIAVVRVLREEGVIGRHFGLEVSFENGATPLERMRVVAGMTLSEAWQYERKRYSLATGRFELNLGVLLGLD